MDQLSADSFVEVFLVEFEDFGGRGKGVAISFSVMLMAGEDIRRDGRTWGRHNYGVPEFERVTSCVGRQLERRKVEARPADAYLPKPKGV